MQRPQNLTRSRCREYRVDSASWTEEAASREQNNQTLLPEEIALGMSLLWGTQHRTPEAEECRPSSLR